MSFTSLSLILCILFASIANTQTCYFPDGVTVSTDVVCNSTAPASSCCPNNSFCLDNGLCFGGGVVSRSSCSDPTWASNTCAGYCKNEEKNSAVPITPCGTSTDGATTFACGANSSVCSSSDTFTMSGGSSFVLRTSQLQALLGAATNTNLTSITAGLYTGGQLAGIGIGVALPLFLGLVVSLLFLYRERRKQTGPKLMYRLPDDVKDSYPISPPPQAWSPYAGSQRMSLNGARSIPPSRGSATTVGSMAPPAHLATMLARYETMKTGRTALVDETEMMPTRRHELVGSPAATPPPQQVVFRHELPDNERSPR